MNNEEIDETTMQAIVKYGNEIATNKIIEEGGFLYSVNDIKNYIKDYISITNERPTVIIDYLQILAPSEHKFTEKQQIDYNVTTLKKISRDYDIPVIAISSFNRYNYSQSATFEAFKESGGIEYTADVLLALQLKLLSNENKDINSKEIKEAKRQTPREVQLVCLKNRNGKSNFEVDFNFYPAFNAFKEQ